MPRARAPSIASRRRRSWRSTAPSTNGRWRRRRRRERGAAPPLSDDAASYLVAAGAGEAARRELGSRFFAFVAPAATLDEARRFVAALTSRHPDATHVCFAWRVGWPPQERAADAGEPAGTAGAPILQALRAAELTDTVAAVVRWFGGTKLGKGGLARAYGDATRDALATLATRRERPRVRLVVRCRYDQIGAVKRLLRAGTVELAGERYGGGVELELTVALEARPALETALAELRLAADPV